MKSEMLSHFEITSGATSGSNEKTIRNAKRDTKGLRNPNQRKSSKKSRRKNENRGSRDRNRGKNRDKSRNKKDRKNHGNKQNGCSKERLFLNFKELGIDVSRNIMKYHEDNIFNLEVRYCTTGIRCFPM